MCEERTLANLPVVVGLGEILWDLLPAGKHLGGAPANFAYIAGLLGASGVVVSRVGGDELGAASQQMLRRTLIDVSTLQVDPELPTGTTEVSVSDEGVASYRIVEGVAWDHLTWTPELCTLAARADAVCFGTLAQRSEESRKTILRFLDETRPDCLRVFDANLRAPFYGRDVMIDSLQRATVVKLNHEEVGYALECSSLRATNDVEAADALKNRWGAEAVCITRGPRGSVIATANGTAVHAGIPIRVVDTIGAGDAFTAAMTMQMLAGASLERVSEAANGIASWIVSRPGAMPAVSAEEMCRLRSAFGIAVERERNDSPSTMSR
ncbi:MAG TPA: carbohydrate kinase [Terriglobales bacterium]|nr:carbohydrate kinase [Terriglobales bacterium]